MSQMNLSFSGCGFMGIYHIGVASAIKEYAPQLISGKITGASAGALAACGLICGSCLGQATSDVLKIVIQARAGALGPMRPSFNIIRVLRQGLLKNLPPDAHKICNGRLHVSLTRFSDGKNCLVSRFDTQEDLVQALICSMFIPFYCGTIPPMYKGERYIDGGWSDNLPSIDENTITVSPFSGESDICPQDSESASFLSFDLRNTNVRFTARNIYRIVTALFPPHPEIMSEMCRQGFEDALRFLAKYDLLSCTSCVAIRSSIAVTSERRQQQQKAMEEVLIVGVPSETDEENSQPPPIDVITATTTPATPSSSAVEPKKPRLTAIGSITKSKTAPRLRSRSSSHWIAPTAGSKRMNSIMSEGHIHNRGETECESCRQAEKIAAGKGLPKVVRDTLASAEAGERTVFSRLLHLAPIKWIRYLTVPWLLPLDITYAMCKKFLEWLPTISDDAMWLIERATEAVRFILNELEAHKQQYVSKITCQVAVTELNYSKMLSGTSVAPTPASVTPALSTTSQKQPVQQQSQQSDNLQIPMPPPSVSRRSSVVGDSAAAPPGKWSVGFTVDMDPRNQNVREMANMVQKDRTAQSRAKLNSNRVAQVVEDLGLEGLQKAVSDENIKQEDLDNFASILQFTRKQEALMQYYYLDENNQMKVTEIYGVPQTENDRLGAFSRSCSRRQSFKENPSGGNGGGGNSGFGRQRSMKDDSGVSGVSAPELEAALLAKVPEASSSNVGQHRKTSKESGSEKNGTGGAGVQRSASFPKHRRTSILQQTGVGGGSASGSGGGVSGRSKTITFVSPISTASESEEHEKLFIPDRRNRRRDSEMEAAAYEPEDLSGDDY